jgi:hypothetical protein
MSHCKTNFSLNTVEAKEEYSIKESVSKYKHNTMEFRIFNFKECFSSSNIVKHADISNLIKAEASKSSYIFRAGFVDIKWPSIAPANEPLVHYASAVFFCYVPVTNFPLCHCDVGLWATKLSAHAAAIARFI